MIKEEATKYEEWLTTIANTRLIYNTMDEFEDMMGNHSIHNNGIKRCFGTQQKLRSAFRDLKVEVNIMTEDTVSLDKLMKHYKKAWILYRENLYRRSNPEKIAFELLSYFYPPYQRRGISKKKLALYARIDDEDINIPLIVLMLLKVIPGYDSKDGDIIEMPHHFDRVMALLEEFTGQGPLFDLLPTITRAREEENKTRIMLLFHVSRILDSYEAYADSENLYDTSAQMKSERLVLDIEGFWNECEGKLHYTKFWQIEALDNGGYFATHWHKDAENKLTGIRYTLFINRMPDGKNVYYLIHPEFIKHRMKGLAYGDRDHVWYQTEAVDDCPQTLILRRMMPSSIWPLSIPLTRCTETSVIAQYERWLKECTVVKQYERLEYVFTPNLYAVTTTHLYIPAEHEGMFFKVPRTAYEGFDRIQIGDNIGTMVMNGRTYLVFDEVLLYIPVTRKELEKYEIEIVNRIS